MGFVALALPRVWGVPGSGRRTGMGKRSLASSRAGKVEWTSWRDGWNPPSPLPPEDQTPFILSRSVFKPETWFFPSTGSDGQAHHCRAHCYFPSPSSPSKQGTRLDVMVWTTRGRPPPPPRVTGPRPLETRPTHLTDVRAWCKEKTGFTPTGMAGVSGTYPKIQGPSPTHGLQGAAGTQRVSRPLTGQRRCWKHLQLRHAETRAKLDGCPAWPIWAHLHRALDRRASSVDCGACTTPAWETHFSLR